MKLYPPNIKGTIPAFCEENLIVPFTMNKTVSRHEVKGFRLQIKTVNSNTFLGVIDSDKWNFDLGEIYFNLDLKNNEFLSKNLKVGSFYKLQIAYINAFDDSIGYYSSVGVIKYTSKPYIEITNLSFSDINMNNNVYVGYYSQEGKDLTERVYSYQFNVYDASGNLYDTSGECLHNSSEDEKIGESSDSFTFNKDLVINKNYSIQYIVKTINGLTIKSNRYRIMQKETIDPEIYVDIDAKLNSDNAYIEVGLVGHKDEFGVEYTATGSFVIRRASDEDNFTQWKTVLLFRLNGHTPSKWSWKDFAIEHGKSYRYAIQQFNDSGLYSNKILSNTVYASFEDAFLWDGKKQLRISFNPKINSFKTTILESKTDTIGSKYPFVFRNGYVNYKEFSISGLISYHSDKEELFIKKEELKIDKDDFITSLIDQNIYAERIFKLKVLEWLNDGEPKVFKSPTEGNYIIRLMNVSLSPQETLGRMLHTFSASACEIDTFNYDTLLNRNFIKLINIDSTLTRWKNIFFLKSRNEETGSIEYFKPDEEILNNNDIATSIKIENVQPGTQFKINHVAPDAPDEEIDIITVGMTGVYNIDLNLGLKIYSVKLITDNVYDGNLTYSYETNIANVFDTVKDVAIKDIPLRQFIGINDIIKEINNIKTNLLEFTYLSFSKRELRKIYTKDNLVYYWDADCKNKPINNEQDLDFFYLYKAINILNDQIFYFDKNLKYPVEYSNEFILNGSKVDLTAKDSYLLKNPGLIKDLTIGSGLILECAYQIREVKYNLENENSIYEIKEVVKAKNAYEKANQEYLRLLRWEELDNYYYYNDSVYKTEEDVENAKQDIQNRIDSIIKEINNYENDLNEAKNLKDYYENELSDGAELQQEMDQLNLDYNLGKITQNDYMLRSGELSILLQEFEQKKSDLEYNLNNIKIEIENINSIIESYQENLDTLNQAKNNICISGYSENYFIDLRKKEKVLKNKNTNNRNLYEEYIYQLEIALKKQQEENQYYAK